MTAKRNKSSKKNRIVDDSYESSEQIIENFDSYNSSLTNILIEDVITPTSESIVTKDSQSKNKKKCSNENKIDSNICELSVSGEYETKKKKKKHKNILGNEHTVPDFGIYTESIVDEHKDLSNEHKNKLNKKKSEKKDEYTKSTKKDGIKQEIETNEDCNSCSIFSSESFTKSTKKDGIKKEIEFNEDCNSYSIFSSECFIKSDDETDANGNQNFENVVFDQIQKKNKKNHKDSKRRISNQDYLQNCEIITTEEITTKKRKKQEDESSSKKSKKRKHCENIAVEVNSGENSTVEFNNDENYFSKSGKTAHFEESSLSQEDIPKRNKKSKRKKICHEESSEINQDATKVIHSGSSIGISGKDVSILKEQNTKKKCLSDFISSSLMDGLTSKLSEIVKTESQSTEYEEISMTEGITTHFNESSLSHTNEDMAEQNKRSPGKKSKKNFHAESNKINQEESKSEVNKKKKSLSNFISSSLLDGLTSQLDEMIKKKSQENSMEYEGKRTEGITTHFNESSLSHTNEDMAEQNKRSPGKKSKKNFHAESNKTNQEESKLEVNKKKKSLSNFISSSLLDGLTSQLDEMIKKKSQENSMEYEGKRTEDELSSGSDLSKNTELTSIPFDQVEEKVEKDVDKNIENQTLDNCRKQNITDKKKIIELLKKTKSIDRIKEELNIKDVDWRKRLKHFKIILPFSLPNIHQIARNTTLKPSMQQRLDLEAAGIKLKTGKYTKEEDQKIIHNWKLFCKYNDWEEENYQPFVMGSSNSKYGVLQKKKYQKFVQFMSHNFEDRLMYSIYDRFKRIFMQNDIDCDSFTPEDDKIITEYINGQTGTTPFADLAVLLKRPRLALLKRYKKLQAMKLFDNSKVTWDESLCREFFSHILRVTKCRLSDLKNRHITTEEWEKIAMKIDIPAEKLNKVWRIYFHPRLVYPLFDEMYEEIRHKLVKIVSEKYTNLRDIDWQYVTEEMGNEIPSNGLFRMYYDIQPEKFDSLQAIADSNHDRRKTRKFSFVKKIFEEMQEEEETRFSEN